MHNTQMERAKEYARGYNDRMNTRVPDKMIDENVAYRSGYDKAAKELSVFANAVPIRVKAKYFR
jgi:hypothetical protein